MKETIKQFLKKNKLTHTLLFPLIWKRRNIVIKRNEKKRQFLQELSSSVIGGSLIVDMPDYRGEFEIDIRSHVLHVILLYSDYESEMVGLIEKYLNPDKDVVDIGANIGLHTVLFSKLLGPGKKVLAVEPTPNALVYLQSNLLRNNCVKNVEVFKGIATDTEGQFCLNTIEGMEEYSTIGQMNHPNISGYKASAINVKGTTIDKLVSSHQLSPGFIKIDTEGAEFKVLTGAREVLNTFRPIILSELSEKLLSAQGNSCKDVYNYLNSFNYKIYDADTLIPVTGPLEGEILAIPK